MFIEVSQSLKRLSKFFPENLYVVGGYVRNKILGFNGADVDLCSSVNIEEVSRRLAGTEFSVKIKNINLGTVVISCPGERYEYTSFRKEIYAEGGSHFPIEVQQAKKIEEDVERRDFSINAIYYNINKDSCVDLCHGIVDLSDKVLRACNENVFLHDGERILRMVRIAGELGFRIDKKTLKSAQKNVKNLEDLQKNRFFGELEKILYCDKRFGQKKKNLKIALNQLNTLSIWRHLDLNVKKVKFDMIFKVEDRFLGFLIDIVGSANPECLETFLENLLKKHFGFSSEDANKVFVLLGGYYNALYGMQNKEYFFKYFENWAGIYSILSEKSKRVRNKYQFFYRYIIEHGLCIKLSDLNLNERDIKKEFPQIDKRNHTRILQSLLSKVFDGKVKNERSALLEEIKENLLS